MLKNRDKIYNMVVFALMIALCYVATFIMIPLPTGGKIHLGNLVCIISALLLGGVKGGLVGSIGMGLNDLHFYLDTPSTLIRTLILKFLMGLICGLLFRFLYKREKTSSTKIFFFIFSLLSLLLAIFSLYAYMNGGIIIEDTTISFNILVSICLFLISILFFIFGLIIKKENKLITSTALAVFIATIFNIIGEFVFRLFLYAYLDRMGISAAFVLSLTNVPASILTGMLTFIASIVVFLNIHKIMSTYNKNYLI